MSGEGLEQVVEAFGAGVFESAGAGRFRLRNEPPEWLRRLHSCAPLRGAELDLAERYPYLEDFLPDAERFWSAGAEGRLFSGIWTEEDEAGCEVHLEAFALRTSGAPRTLVIRSLEGDEGERQALYQKARETLWALERLHREVQKKELLPQCIVHDLKGPLAGIVGHLSLLESRPLAPERSREIAGKALVQARRQFDMIRLVLEVFAAEVDQLESFETRSDAAPDLRAAVQAAVETLQPAYEQRAIGLELDAGARSLEPLPVIGQRERLERVLVNLLENALRYAPEGTQVELTVVDEGETVLAAVEDRGPGVPEELALRLFEKFGRAGRSGGLAGLGLYSARLAVQRWGGSIGYEPRAGGGARCWFRLRKALD